MDTIASFQVDHNVLKKGLYLSRIDGNVYTYDLRFKEPNQGDYLSVAAMHTIEHLLATAARNSASGAKVVYVGPMGCRTGFYVLLFDTDLATARTYILDWIDAALAMPTIPGNKKIECGNYRSHNMAAAKAELRAYRLVIGD